MLVTIFLYPLVASAIESSPCLTEKSAYELSNNSIAEAVTQQLDLRTLISSVKERRQAVLVPALKESESQLDSANRSVMQETRLLNVILEHRPLLDSITNNLEKHVAFNDKLTALIAVNSEISLSNALRSSGSRETAELDAFAQLIRSLEGSRTWGEQMMDFRAEVPQGARALQTAIQKISIMQELLSQSLSSAQLSSVKQKVADAQARIDASNSEQRSLEDKSASLQKRLELLKENLPKQGSALHACMHKAQFGE